MSTANVPPGVGCRSARSPIQAIMRSGVTRWAKTISGGAAISIDVANSGIRLPVDAARFGFRGCFQAGEPGWPEGIQELLHGLQAVGADDEQVPRALVALGDQAGAAQDAQVMRDGLLGHRDVGR